MDTVVNMQALGEQVLLHRRRAGLSQQEIAARAGLDTMTISRIESGVKKRLEIETAARLARVLGVSLDQLCGLEPPVEDVVSLASAPARVEPGSTRNGRLETPRELTAQILSWHEDEGLTLQAIVQRLNAAGVPTRSGRGQWYQASVSELLGRVQFWSFLQPSRQEIGSYRSLIYSIRSLVNGINMRHGTPEWMPIRLELGENIRRAMAAYKNFDVLLVNSIFDGMNLVAKEGMVVNDRDGVLVLSENAGVHEQLGEHALTINPFEVDSTAQALFDALTMDAAERHRRADGCRAAVRANHIGRWIDEQLNDLEEVCRSRTDRLAG